MRGDCGITVGAAIREFTDMLVVYEYDIAVAVIWDVRICPCVSTEIKSYPSPICETLCLAISFNSLISPPAGAFDKVKVVKSTVAGRTSNS